MYNIYRNIFIIIFINNNNKLLLRKVHFPLFAHTPKHLNVYFPTFLLSYFLILLKTIVSL